MTTLTSTGSFTVGSGSVVTISAPLVVIPAASVGSGTGRLIHPTFGTFDYLRGPDEWQNMDGDAIIAPIWSSTKTLLGAANTLFVGDLRDVVVEERWTQRVAMELDQARMFIAMWQLPPDPAAAYVQWYPSYANDLGFNVVLLDLIVGGSQGINLSPLVNNGEGWVRGPVTIKMRIVSRIE